MKKYSVNGSEYFNMYYCGTHIVRLEKAGDVIKETYLEFIGDGKVYIRMYIDGKLDDTILVSDFEKANKPSCLDDKEALCGLLCKVLQKTRGAADLVSLTYDSESEIVTAAFVGGTNRINVAMDSGMAMIRDIVNHLGC